MLKERRSLQLIEVRGPLPESIACPDTGETFFTDGRGGTVPKKSAFACKEETCGLVQDVLTSIKKSGKSGPTAAYAVQGYCPACDEEKLPYSGRFFAIPVMRPYDVAYREWELRRDLDLCAYWPKSEVPYGFMTHHNNGGIANHGFTHWWTMFNSRQLLVNSQLLKATATVDCASWDVREYIIGAFQQYLRNQNLFCIWDKDYDKLVPHMSNNNYHPKATMVENSVFPHLGRGNWESCVAGIEEGLSWQRNPWESLPKSELERVRADLSAAISGKSTKVIPGDPVRNGHSFSAVPLAN